MKTISPSPLTPDQRLAAVRGIVEGTRPTGRRLRTIPVQDRRAVPCAPPAWIAPESPLAELHALNLVARLKAKR